ncbi:MAG: NUDIX hydrolase [Phycisphaerales bacterium]
MASLQEQSRRIVHRGTKFNLEVLTLRGSARTLTREVVRHPGAVVILPILDDGRLAFVRVWRIALAKWSLELPAGTLEPGESPRRCAARELIEETGYQAATITPLARFHTSPGMSDELMRAYVARGLSHVGARPEEDELLRPQMLASAKALSLVERGRISDGKSIATLLLAARQGLI